MKAGANIGSVIGQFGFGFAADYFGRKAVCKLISLLPRTLLSSKYLVCGGLGGGSRRQGTDADHFCDDHVYFRSDERPKPERCTALARRLAYRTWRRCRW